MRKSRSKQTLFYVDSRAARSRNKEAGVGQPHRSRGGRILQVLQSPDAKGTGPCFRATVSRQNALFSPKNGPVPGLCSSRSDFLVCLTVHSAELRISGFPGWAMKRLADEKVLVLDFGSQYAQLIARRVRQQHVYCEIVRHDITAERIRELAPKGIILSGGPASVYEPGAPKCDPEIFRLGLPVLGICYGLHLACQALGGQVQGTPTREYGRARCRVTRAERTVRRRARRDRRVDEPRRSGVAGLRRFRAAGRHRHLPGRRGEASAVADLRPAVPSRSDAHAAGREDPRQLPQDACAVARARGSWAISPARRSRRSAAAWATTA